LQRNAKQGHPAYFVAHDLEELMNIGSLLHVVGQMKMRIIQQEGVSGSIGSALWKAINGKSHYKAEEYCNY
jgi:hypothetical protein